jgi:hypothetical protein
MKRNHPQLKAGGFPSPAAQPSRKRLAKSQKELRNVRANDRILQVEKLGAMSHSRHFFHRDLE